MAAQTHLERHSLAARQMLKGLEPQTRNGGDVRARATVALAHAVLALAEQLRVLHRDGHRL
jgi:hypothetical protein